MFWLCACHLCLRAIGDIGLLVDKKVDGDVTQTSSLPRPLLGTDFLQPLEPLFHFLPLQGHPRSLGRALYLGIWQRGGGVITADSSQYTVQVWLAG